MPTRCAFVVCDGCINHGAVIHGEAASRRGVVWPGCGRTGEEANYPKKKRTSKGYLVLWKPISIWNQGPSPTRYSSTSIKKRPKRHGISKNMSTFVVWMNAGEGPARRRLGRTVTKRRDRLGSRVHLASPAAKLRDSAAASFLLGGIRCNAKHPCAPLRAEM